MRTSILCAGTVLLAAVAATSAEEHRLFTESYLTIGNEWHYDTLFYMMSGRPMELRGSAALSISGSSQISGYNVKVVNALSPWGEVVSYASLTGEIVSVIGKTDGEGTETLKNNDPLETYPLWVDESANNLHIGHGQFQGAIPGYTWTRTYDTYLTYFGQETITVPAGSFSCRKVLIKTEYTDSDGERHKTEDLYWINPAIGIIKQDTYEWIRYADASEDDARYLMELTSTNVSPQPYCRVRSLPMDFTGDCRVNLADFAVFLQNWMTCEIEPADACFPDSGPSLSPSKAVYRPGEAITVSFNHAAGNRRDWLGLYNVGEPDNAYLRWKFTDGTTIGTDGLSNGTVTFSGLPVGQYEARLFFNGSYHCEAKGQFKVAE